ncbi:DMT family transporter [Hamadaea flava]|uniref:DMT family transporter n=1 Tax=Hamadaea flava TaxID=1742688 RepID=A0ABV8LPX5_9ACTN|nr:DMT family transporter [Hamadaea flava]
MPRRSSLLTLIAVAALWGASFLFIRIGVRDLGPVALIEARVALAGLALLAIVTVLRRRPSWRDRWRYLMLGLLSAAAPFTLIAAAELHLTASLAAILNATTPMFSLLLSAWWLREPLTVRKLAGVMVGVLGVAVLVGLGPIDPGPVLWASVAASLVAALLYAAGGIYAATRFSGVAPISVATGQQLAAAVLLLPLAAALPPAELPGPSVTAAVLALALACTALGFVLFYRLVAQLGSTGALTVTYLVPVFGSAWGALFLGERLSIGAGLGLLLVLGGVALVTRPSAPTPASAPDPAPALAPDARSGPGASRVDHGVSCGVAGVSSPETP